MENLVYSLKLTVNYQTKMRCFIWMGRIHGEGFLMPAAISGIIRFTQSVAIAILIPTSGVCQSVNETSSSKK